MNQKYSVWVNDYEYLGQVPIKNLSFNNAKKLMNNFIHQGFDNVEIEKQKDLNTLINAIL
jgi:hypothetical protein